MIRKLILMAALVIGCATGSAQAALFEFTFDDASIGGHTGSTPTSNTIVQGYMNSVLLGSGVSVSVTGAGGLSDSYYTADNHVIGPYNTTTHVVTPYTLGNTTGSPSGPVPDTSLSPQLLTDGYIVNNGATTITMVFTRPIYSISFDFEIFPDGGCLNSSCGTSNWPDFEFYAGTTTSNGVLAFTQFGCVPGASSAPSGSTFSSCGEVGLSTHSTLSAMEATPQYLGSFDTNFSNGVSVLNFVDWPQRIGIDDLAVTTIPEPGTLALLGVGLAGLGFRRRARAH